MVVGYNKIMTTITQIERQFLYSRGFGDSQKSLMQIRREFFVSYLGGAQSTEGIESLEKRFIRKVISNNSGTPSQYPKYSEAVSSLSITPAGTESENKILLYQNLP